MKMCGVLLIKSGWITCAKLSFENAYRYNDCVFISKYVLFTEYAVLVFSNIVRLDWYLNRAHHS